MNYTIYVAKTKATCCYCIADLRLCKMKVEVLCFSDKSGLRYDNGKLHFHRIMTLCFVARLLIISNVSN